NNDHFTVEAGPDGINFLPVAQLTGAGNSSVMRHYSWTDMRPMAGVSYYRLKQTDTDGFHAYSATVPVNCSQQPDITIFPNPTHGTCPFSVPEDRASQPLEVEVCYSIGQLVLRQVFDTGTGGSREEISPAQVPEGIYYIIFR